MNNYIRLVYDVINTKVDKTKSWYLYKDNIIFAKLTLPFKVNYFLEATLNNKNGKEPCIILSKDNIDTQCRRCNTDNYGRIKIKPVAFKDYFKSIYNRDSNIKLDIIDISEDYVVIRI